MPTCAIRSEEHTSELQSLRHLVCRLLLERKKATCRRRGLRCPRETSPDRAILPPRSTPPGRGPSPTAPGLPRRPRHHLLFFLNERPTPKTPPLPQARPSPL